MLTNIFKTLLLSVLAIGLVEANLDNQCTGYYLDQSSSDIALGAQCINPNGGTNSNFIYLDECVWYDSGFLETGASSNGAAYVPKECDDSTVDLLPIRIAQNCNNWRLDGTRLFYTCKRNDGITVSSNINLSLFVSLTETC